MRSRISPYEQNTEEILDVLFYGNNVSDDEIDNALVALVQIVGRLQSDVERLRTENQEKKIERSETVSPRPTTEL